MAAAAEMYICKCTYVCTCMYILHAFYILFIVYYLATSHIIQSDCVEISVKLQLQALNYRLLVKVHIHIL